MAIPSLALIPTGFKDGKLYSVLPESGVGDFTAVRGSGATRVNSAGLIEDVRILSGELVTNGDFSNGSTDWQEKSGVIVSVDSSGLVFDNSIGNVAAGVFQNIGLSDGKNYRMTATMQLLTGASNGNFSLQTSTAAGSGQSLVYSGETLVVGGDAVTETFEFTPALGDVSVQLSCNQANATFKISNISVKEVTDATNIPRLDYTDGGCPSLLLEPQSTNLVTYSEDFSNASWTKVNTTIASNDAISPDGAQNADKLIITSTEGVHETIETLATVSGNYTFSIFAKQGEYKNILLWDDGLSGGVGVNLNDLSVFRDQNNQGYEIVDFGNGWVRISLNHTYVSQAPIIGIYVYDNSATPLITYAGDNVSGLHIYGAQFEALSYSTSYIPTSGVIATRLADSVSGAGDATTFNSTEGVLYFEGSALSNENVQRILSISDGTNSNAIQLGFLNSATDYRVFGSVRVGGVSQAFLSYNFGAVAPTFKKCAIRYKQNDFSLWIDGVELVTGTSGNTPIGLNELTFTRGDAGQGLYGKVKDLRTYNTALTDAELLILTTI